jgi:hypothetical protein
LNKATNHLFLCTPSAQKARTPFTFMLASSSPSSSIQKLQIYYIEQLNKATNHLFLCTPSAQKARTPFTFMLASSSPSSSIQKLQIYYIDRTIEQSNKSSFSLHAQRAKGPHPVHVHARQQQPLLFHSKITNILYR